MEKLGHRPKSPKKKNTREGCNCLMKTDIGVQLIVHMD